MLTRVLLGAFGLELRRRATVETSLLRRGLGDVVNHTRRTGFCPGTIIDVGAADGTPGLYDAFPDAMLILVEPLLEYGEALRKVLRQYAGYWIPAAAGRTIGSATMNVHTEHWEGSSLLNEAEGPHIDGIPRTVSMVTIDSTCRETAAAAPFLIKVDVQEAELEVLEGAREVLGSSELIVLEVSLFQFMKNGPQLHDVISYMKDHNFVAYDIFGGRNRPLDGALAQIDIAFVREDGMFRRDHSYATTHQRRLMGFHV
jgi:FkbM family methyltransferase